ncbi:MAG: hypothetical protein WED10_09185 [Brumimicrobium sp.]
MKEINDIFSNRELALFTWVFFLTVISVLWTKTRKSALNLIKAYFQRKIILLQTLIWVYLAGVIWIFSKLGFWNWSMLKDSIIWAVFSAFIIMFGVLNSKRKTRPIRQIFFDAFKLIIIVEFIVNVYCYGFINEMIILPILGFLIMLIAVAETNPENQIVVNFLNGVLAIWGVYVLYSSAQQIYLHINEVATKQTALDFLLPIWLTIFYLPFLALVKTYSDWEQQRLSNRIYNKK